MPVAALHLVQRRHFGHHEARLLQGHLNRVPHRRLAVGEHHRHPTPGLEHAVVFGKAALHQVLVLGQRLVLELVDDGFGLGVGGDAMPGLDQKIQVGVVDVLAEGWIGEDIVHRVVG